MANNKYQKEILACSRSLPIMYIVGLSRVLGSVNAGVLLSQLLYWWGKSKDPEWVYKTVKEIEHETYLTEKQQRTAIRNCIKAGFVERKRKGIPGKRHFHLNIDKIKKAFEDHLDCGF